MRQLTPCLLFFLFIAGNAAGAEDRNMPAAGPNIYMPYAKSRDHFVVGVEIEGYHMRYDLAKKSNIFMVLLPDGFSSLEDTPIYFAINTFRFKGQTVNDAFKEDLASLKESAKNLHVVKEMAGDLIPKAGECHGAELAYPEDERQFPYEIYYVCKSRSKEYVIALSMGAKKQKDLNQHLSNFLFWANAPQIVKDGKVVAK